MTAALTTSLRSAQCAPIDSPIGSDLWNSLNVPG